MAADVIGSRFAAVAPQEMLVASTSRPESWSVNTGQPFFTTGQSRDLAYSATHNLVVVVGTSGRMVSSNSNMAIWTDIDSGFGTSVIEDIAWSQSLGLFVAVGQSGKISTLVPGAAAATPVTAGLGGGNLRSVCWSETVGLFVVTGNGGKIATSPDGVVWTQQASPVTSIITAVCAWR